MPGLGFLGLGLAPGLRQQLGDGFLHGVRRDGDAGDGIHGLAVHNLIGPGAAVVVGEQVVFALGVYGGLCELAVQHGDGDVDGAEIGGLAHGVGAVDQAGGLRCGFGFILDGGVRRCGCHSGLQLGDLRLGFGGLGLGSLGAGLGVGQGGFQLGDPGVVCGGFLRASGGLSQQLVHGLLHGVGGDGDAGDGVHGLLFHDLGFPGIAVLVGEQVVRALGGDVGGGDLAALDGQIDVDGAEVGGLLYVIGAVLQRGGFAAVLSGQQLLNGLLHGVGGDGDAGHRVNGLLFHDLGFPGIAVLVGEQVVRALGGDVGGGDLAALDGQFDIDGAEIGGLFDGVDAVGQGAALIGGRFGRGLRFGLRRGCRLGGGQTGLGEDVRGGLLDRVGGVFQRRGGNHVVLVGLVVHDGLGPLSAKFVGEQVVVAGRGDLGVDDLVARYGHGHLHIAVIVAALGGIGTGLLVDHLAAPADAAGEYDPQDQDHCRYHQHGDRLFFHISIIPSLSSVRPQFAGGRVMTLAGHFWAHLPHWVQLS